MSRVFTPALLLWGSLCFADNILEARLLALEQQVQDLQTQRYLPFEILKNTNQLHTQLSPVASKIYFAQEASWQVGLSSELFTYQEANVDRANVLSVAPALAVRAHRRVIFNSQFLFENGGSESRTTVTLQKGQSIVQMAYLDWLASDKGEAGVRIGHQLIPIGWTNTRQDAVTYLSVLKPELERELIPSTWHENGLSLWLDRPRADVQIGVFNSLDARGFRQDTFLAGGRSQGQNAAANDLMAVLRINAKGEFGLFGLSLASGNTAQKDPALRTSTFRLGEAHARVRWQRFELLGMLTEAQLDDAEAVSIYNATTMGSQARGSSLQIAMNALDGQKQLWFFARTSQYNLHSKVPAGFTADPALKKMVNVFGVSYFPLANLVIKADYSIKRSGADDSSGEFSLALGAVF